MLVVYDALLVTTMQVATWYRAMLVQLSLWGAACSVCSLVAVCSLTLHHMSTFLITMPYLGLFLDGAVLSRASSLTMDVDLETSTFASDAARLSSGLMYSPATFLQLC